MTQPTEYSPTTDFESELGSAHGAHLNAEFEAIRTTLAELIANIGIIQRDDTKLANLTVHPDALTSATMLLLGANWRPRGLWATVTNYLAGDVVETGGNSYVATVDHIAGVFATDHAAGKWIVIYEPLSSAGLSASGIAFTPAGTIVATNVQSAIAEVAGEAAQKGQNLADLADKPAALAILGGVPLAGGSMTGALALKKGANINAAGTVNLATATGNSVTVSGAATISSFGTVQDGAIFFIDFDGVCTLVHNATSLKLPGQANITTVAGDSLIAQSLGAGNWRVIAFTPTAYTLGPAYINTFLGSFLKADTGIAGAQFSFRNLIINGALRINQRFAVAAQTFTAGAALAYCADRFYGFCTGANVTGQTINASGTDPAKYRFNGAASVTGIGLGHRIESAIARRLAGKTAVLSARIANSVLSSVTWTAYRANAADAFGTLASPTRTQIATGAFTVNSTLTRYQASFSIPSLGENGIEIVFTVGAQTAGTFEVAEVQLEEGTVATPFEVVPLPYDLSLCERYYEKTFPINTAPAQNAGVAGCQFQSQLTTGSNVMAFGTLFRTRKRSGSTPTVTLYNPSAANSQPRNVTQSADCNGFGASNQSDSGFLITGQCLAAGAVGNTIAYHWTAEAEVP